VRIIEASPDKRVEKRKVELFARVLYAKNWRVVLV